MKQTFIILFAIITVFSSCRYEEGPLISLRTAEGRLSNSWQFDLVLRNGLNVTKGEGTVEINFANSSIGFDKTGRFSVIYETDSGDLEYDGFWTLTDKNVTLNMDYIDASVSDVTYTILRLTANEFWFREEIGSVVFEYRCSPNR